MMTSASVMTIRVHICFIVMDVIHPKYHLCSYTKFFLFNPLNFCDTVNTFHTKTCAECHVTVDF